MGGAAECGSLAVVERHSAMLAAAGLIGRDQRMNSAPPQWQCFATRPQILLVDDTRLISGLKLNHEDSA